MSPQNKPQQERRDGKREREGGEVRWEKIESERGMLWGGSLGCTGEGTHIHIHTHTHTHTHIHTQARGQHPQEQPVHFYELLQHNYYYHHQIKEIN